MLFRERQAEGRDQARRRGFLSFELEDEEGGEEDEEEEKEEKRRESSKSRDAFGRRECVDTPKKRSLGTFSSSSSSSFYRTSQEREREKKRRSEEDRYTSFSKKPSSSSTFSSSSVVQKSSFSERGDREREVGEHSSSNSRDKSVNASLSCREERYRGGGEDRIRRRREDERERRRDDRDVAGSRIRRKREEEEEREKEEKKGRNCCVSEEKRRREEKESVEGERRRSTLRSQEEAEEERNTERSREKSHSGNSGRRDDEKRTHRVTSLKEEEEKRLTKHRGGVSSSSSSLSSSSFRSGSSLGRSSEDAMEGGGGRGQDLHRYRKEKEEEEEKKKKNALARKNTSPSLLRTREDSHLERKNGSSSQRERHSLQSSSSSFNTTKKTPSSSSSASSSLSPRISVDSPSPSSSHREKDDRMQDHAEREEEKRKTNVPMSSSPIIAGRKTSSSLSSPVVRFKKMSELTEAKFLGEKKKEQEERKHRHKKDFLSLHSQSPLSDETSALKIYPTHLSSSSQKDFYFSQATSTALTPPSFTKAPRVISPSFGGGEEEEDQADISSSSLPSSSSWMKRRPTPETSTSGRDEFDDFRGVHDKNDQDEEEEEEKKEEEEGDDCEEGFFPSVKVAERSTLLSRYPSSSSSSFSFSVNEDDRHLSSSYSSRRRSFLYQNARERGFGFSYGSASTVGRRQSMEDAMHAIPTFLDGNAAYFSVFDGHNGSRLAHYSALHLHRLLEEHLRSSQVVSSLSPLACELSKQSISRSLIESFHEIDTNYKTSFPGSKDGSTALVLFLRWIEDRRWLNQRKKGNSRGVEEKKMVDAKKEDGKMSELKTRKKKKITRESGESPAGGDKERGRDHQDEEEDEDEDVSERKYLVELYLAHAGDTRAVLGVTTSPGPFSVEETGSHLSFDGVASSSYISRGEERDRHGKNEVDKRDRERGMRKKDHGERRSPLEKRDEREGGGEKDEEEEEEENEEEHGDNTMEKKKKSCLVGKTRRYTRMKGERLTSDHKPNRSDEKSRIERHGGSVIDLGCPRVMAGSVDMALAVSRCLGDFALKEVSEHIIIATPEVSTRRLTPERDAFVIIASDGLWDVLTDDDAVSIVQRRLDRYFHRGREGRDGRHDLKNAKSKERMGMPVMAPSRRGSSTIISARGGGGRLSIEINKGENKMIQDKKQKKDGWYDEGEDVEEEEEEDGHTISSSYGGRNEEEDEEGREQHESACNNSRTEFKANEGECSWWETSRSRKIRVADLTRKTKEKEEKKKGRDDKERNQDEEEEEMKNRRINSKGEEGGENLTSRPNGVKKKRLPPRNQGEVEEEDADTFEDYAPKEILEDAANELIRVALSRRSQDNITVLILHFSWRLKKKHNTSTVKMT